jgi:hypothetical protein
MQHKLLRRARRLLEEATGLWPPSNITLEWADDLPDGVSGRFVPEERLIKLSTTCRDPRRALVHELAHLTHWDATQFAGVCAQEVEQFAVAATLLVDVMLYGKVVGRYSAFRQADKAYYEAELWFGRHTPEQVKAWMSYVLCF